MNANHLLLPSGLYDLLPPEARMESKAVQRLLSCFESFGYAEVNPPLLELEAGLLSGRGGALAAQTFRVMDPMSQAMMGFRADMTLQVARIATTRMAAAPRPLRLCYAGATLRTKPDALKSERQLTQAGIELIGQQSLQADAEVMIVAAEALKDLGITGISIDINLPGLLVELCPEAEGNEALGTQIKDAIQRRDSGMITSLSLKNNRLLASLMEAAGPADKALATLQTLGLAQAASLAELIAHVRRHCQQVQLTLDPLEYRGFSYHQGIGFSLFAEGLRHELGRGGRYRTANEDATGFSLYVTHLLQLLPSPEERKRILMPIDAPEDEARKLRQQGWATIIAMTDNLAAEAKRLDISHIWQKGAIAKL